MVTGHLEHGARALGHDHVAGVASRTGLDAGADVRRLGHDQRHGLLLHVGAHQGTVGVVVLDEGDQRGRDRDDLLRADVDQVDLRRWHEVDLRRGAVAGVGRSHAHTGAGGATTHEDLVLGEVALGVDLGVGLGDDVLFLFVGGEVDDLVGDATVHDLAVGGLDEAEVIDPGIGGERADQANVRAFWGLDRAHAAVVGRVDVTNLEASTLARQTTGAERREATLVGEARERVVLVHELAELAGPEELLDRCHHRADVDEALRGDRLDVLGAHALTDDALHPGEAHADLVLDELADRADAPVGEVVLVVDAVRGLGLAHVLGEVQHVGAGCEDLRRGQRVLVDAGLLELDAQDVLDAVDLRAELAVQLVATDTGEVVPLLVEEGVLEVLPRRLGAQRLAWTGALVDLEEGLFTGRDEPLFLGPLVLEEVEVADELVEEGVVLVAKGPQQDEQRQATLARHAGAGVDRTVRLVLDVELDPLTTVGVDGAREEGLGVTAGGEDRTRGADQLGDDDTLGAVDHEGATIGHDGEVPHEDRLLLDLAGVGVLELGPDEHRGGVRHVLFLALLHRELRRRAQVRVVRVELKHQLETAREVLDRADVLEGLLEAIVEERLEAVALDRDQVGQRQRLIDVGK